MLDRQRELIGTIGWRILMVAALLIHAATVVIAFRAYGGLAGLGAAILSALIPVAPEVYWTARTALATGTMAHWYILAVIGYPIAWLLFLLGGIVFLPRRTPPPGT